MDSFCVERMSISPRLRARHGLLRSQALAVCDDAERAAGLVAHSAQEAADALLEKARSMPRPSRWTRGSAWRSRRRCCWMA